MFVAIATAVDGAGFDPVGDLVTVVFGESALVL